jgi:hypothetical protein
MALSPLCAKSGLPVNYFAADGDHLADHGHEADYNVVHLRIAISEGAACARAAPELGPGAFRGSKLWAAGF